MEDGSLNGTTEAPPENPYYVHQIVLDGLFLVLILMGNIAVLVVIINEGKKSRMNFYIKNLAVADMLCGFFYVLPRIIIHVNNGMFYGGNILCKIQEYLSAFGIYGSNTIMVALGIDRLYLLVVPVGSLAVRRRQPVVVCVLCWVFAAAASISGPIVFHYKRQECTLDLNTDEIKIYFTTIFVGVFVIPTLIIVGCYLTIAIIIWKVSRRSQGLQLTEISSSSQQESTLMSSPPNSSLLSRPRADSNSTITKAKIKTIKMTFVIAIAFLICWSPFMFVNLLDVYDYIEVPRAFGIFSSSLLPLNSVVNPLIYAAFSARVCKQFRRKLRRRLSASNSRKTEMAFINKE